MIFFEFAYNCLVLFVQSALFGSLWWPLFAFGVLFGILSIIKHFAFLR